MPKAELKSETRWMASWSASVRPQCEPCPLVATRLALSLRAMSRCSFLMQVRRSTVAASDQRTSDLAWRMLPRMAPTTLVAVSRACRSFCVKRVQMLLICRRPLRSDAWSAMAASGSRFAAGGSAVVPTLRLRLSGMLSAASSSRCCCAADRLSWRPSRSATTSDESLNPAGETETGEPGPAAGTSGSVEAAGAANVSVGILGLASLDTSSIVRCAMPGSTLSLNLLGDLPALRPGALVRSMAAAADVAAGSMDALGRNAKDGAAALPVVLSVNGTMLVAMPLDLSWTGLKDVLPPPARATVVSSPMLMAKMRVAMRAMAGWLASVA